MYVYHMFRIKIFDEEKKTPFVIPFSARCTLYEHYDMNRTENKHSTEARKKGTRANDINFHI